MKKTKVRPLPTAATSPHEVLLQSQTMRRPKRDASALYTVWENVNTLGKNVNLLLGEERSSKERREIQQFFGDLQQLDIALKSACLTAEKGDPGSLRRSLADVLGSLLNFYWSDFEVSSHLRVLYWASHDLDSGIVNPLFKPDKLKGRATDPSLVWGARMRTAAGIECLISSGMSKKAAIRYAAQNYTKLGNLVRPGQELRGCLTVWHRSFMNGRIKNDTMQDSFTEQALYYGFGARPSDVVAQRKYLRLAKSYLEHANAHALRVVVRPS